MRLQPLQPFLPDRQPTKVMTASVSILHDRHYLRGAAAMMDDGEDGEAVR
jgi:hypothetical protein